MKNSIPRGIALTIAALTLTVHAQQAQYPTILQQPADQCVAVGGTATYSVVATNATGYQWMFNGSAVDGATNSSVTVSNVTLSNVGYYSAYVYNGADAVPTRSAGLDVYVTAGSTSIASSSLMKTSSMMSPMGGPLGPGGPPIVVYGLPVASSGNSPGCPGRYSGFVNYIPSSDWGFTLSTNATSYSGTDTNQTNTKVQYVGEYGDVGCSQTTASIPFPAFSPEYRFTIYFPNNSQVPTNAYPIVLNGF